MPEALITAKGRRKILNFFPIHAWNWEYYKLGDSIPSLNFEITVPEVYQRYK